MDDASFSYYEVLVRGGPGHAEVSADVTYYTAHGETIGWYGETLVAFAATWKDVAEVVRKGMRTYDLDNDPCHEISPMVDLT